MKDANGKDIELGVGAVYVGGKKTTPEDRKAYAGRFVTVRSFSVGHRVNRAEIRIDDGDPQNADLHTNGFRWSAWVEPTDVAVVPGSRGAT